jgi:hypothetical protein
MFQFGSLVRQPHSLGHLTEPKCISMSEERIVYEADDPYLSHVGQQLREDALFVDLQ